MKLNSKEVEQLSEWVYKETSSYETDFKLDSILLEYIISMVESNHNVTQLKKYLTLELEPFFRKNAAVFAKRFVRAINEMCSQSTEVKQAQNLRNLQMRSSSFGKAHIPLSKIGKKPVKKRQKLSIVPHSFTPREKLMRMIVEKPYPKASTLIVANLPKDHLSEPKIVGYFERFGDIKSVILFKEDNFAKIQFETDFGAELAWNCPNPIFSNRFIELHFAKPTVDDKISIDDLICQQRTLNEIYERKTIQRVEFVQKVNNYLEQKETMLNKHNDFIQLLNKKLQVSSSPQETAYYTDLIASYENKARNYGYHSDIFLPEKARIQQKLKSVKS